MRLVSWIGPALVILGLIGIAAIFLQPPDDRSTLDWWLLSDALAYERVLPLVGLGAALALVDLSQCVAGFAFFGLGIALGFLFADPFLSTLMQFPNAVAHHFLTGPILSAAVGVSLAVPGKLRKWVLPFGAIVAGAMFAIAIRLTDPSFHGWTIAFAGIAVGLWILAGVCLTVRAFRQPWFETAGRILGSWLIAIGLLYGGASLAPPRDRVPPRAPQASSPAPNQLTGPSPDISLPELDRSNRQRLPGGFNPSRQP